jgi:hypothetical protein
MTIVDETVRYGGPQRVLYSTDRMVRCDWSPLHGGRGCGSVSLQWRHDEMDDWHGVPGGKQVCGPESEYVSVARMRLLEFVRPDRLDRSYIMGRGPLEVSWSVAQRPGVVQVAYMDDGRNYPPPPPHLTAPQVRAIVGYLAEPDPERGWWGAGDLSFRVGQHAPGHGRISFRGELTVRIFAPEWIRVLTEGLAALEGE